MKYTISSLLYLIILFSLDQFVFAPSHLYYEIPWLDIPMHVMGGFGVASLTLSLVAYNGKKISYQAMVAVFLVVAVGWELYEIIHDMIIHKVWGGWVDTISDVINGGIGASIAYYLLKK